MLKQITIKQLKKYGFNVIELKYPVALIAGSPMKAIMIEFDNIEDVKEVFSDELQGDFPLFVVVNEKDEIKREIEGYGLEFNGYFLRVFHS